MPRPTVKIKTIAIIAAIAGAAYYFYAGHVSSGGWGAGAAPPVSVASVTDHKVREWHAFSGRLVAIDQAEVRPRVSGVIEKVHFEDGAQVNKDDILFTIDPRPFAAEVTHAEGVLGSAEAQLNLARTELARAERLIREKAIPQQQFDQRRNDFNVADANVKSARAELEVARLNLEYANVRAPISGRASRAEITAGNLVETGSNAPLLTTIIANQPIYADFEIDEATFMQYAHAGATGLNEVASIPVAIELNGESNAMHKGHVESFDNRLNTSSGTIRVRAVFPNEDGVLVPGLFARIRLGGPTENDTVLITDRAVQTDQNKKFVYVVGKDNKVAYREITLGPLVENNLRVVTSGLKPGENIVVGGTQRIMMPGQEVKPEVVPMDEAADSRRLTDDGKKDKIHE